MNNAQNVPGTLVTIRYPVPGQDLNTREFSLPGCCLLNIAVMAANLV